MTLREELSTFRGLVKEITDDTKIKDSLLYSLWKKGRGSVYENNPRKFVSSWNKHRFCVELEDSINHDCSCVPEGCEVRVSIHKLPRPVSTNSGEFFKITTLGRRTIGLIDETDLSSESYDEAKVGKLRASIYNQRPYVMNTNSLKYIMVEGVWEDITEWEDIKVCGTVTDGNSTVDIQCVSVYDLELGISEADSDLIIKNAINLLKIHLSLADDVNANRNTEVKA